jgi:hypothetical protein
MKLNRALGVVLLSCGLLTGQTAYFPPDVLDEDRQSSEFRVVWYSKHLQTMQNPLS